MKELRSFSIESQHIYSILELILEMTEITVMAFNGISLIELFVWRGQIENLKYPHKCDACAK